ncbi:MAG: DUF4097 domain-containing protein [Acidobacteriota bacterium]|nr:DUF4097 domain-containing protein [Acidobacteriota bacterium]
MEVPGSLKVIGWDRGSVRVEAEKIVTGMSEEAAREFLKKSPIRIRYTDAVSTIAVTGAPPLPATLEVNLTIYLPKMRTDLTVGVKQGNFSIDTVNGWVEATLAAGDLAIKNVDGYFSGKTVRGDIHADLWGDQWRGQSFTAVTQAGRVDLLLPEKYSAALQLDTRNGTITVDYPPQEVEGELLPPDVVIQKTTQQLKATIGDGGGTLRLGTQSGDVTLTKK